MINQKLAKDMAFKLLFQNLERYELEIFNTGSQWGMLLVPKVSISDCKKNCLKLLYFKKFEREKAKTCLTNTLGQELSFFQILTLQL